MSVLPPSRLASAPSRPSSARLAKLLELASGVDALGQAALRRAVLVEALRRDRALIEGVARYRRHEYRRTLPDPPVRWAEGATRLYDYGVPPRRAKPKVLFVPSLINRAYVLDLMEGSSMLRWLSAAGLQPLLLDWGWPGQVERRFTLTDYVAGRLERAIQALPGRIILAGYCMGGLLALAAALRQPRRVRALVLLATPWDFHTGVAHEGLRAARLLPFLEPALAATDSLPVDLLQMMFVGIDPFGVAAKYRAFASLDPSSARARLFVALEDWLNDGIPLAAPVARECLGGWYGANTPARNVWRIAGLAVDPRSLAVPTFIAIPARDKIVPPESAAALAAAISGATLCRPMAGHIGMVVGSGAEAALWRPLARWICSL